MADLNSPPWRWVGIGVAVVVTNLSLWGFLQGPLTAYRLVLAIAVVLLYWLDLLVFLPRWVFLPVAVIAAVAMSGGRSDNVILFLPVLACGEAAITGTLLDAVVTLTTSVAAIMVDAALTRAPALDYFSTPIGCLLASVVSMVVRVLQNLNAQLRASQGAMAVQAALEERRRLAREIHDVIAHSMTVTMLHVGGARLALSDDPPDVSEAIAALEEAERQGRQSLADIRTTVGLLNAAGPTPADESPFAAPAPRVEEIGTLISTYRDAGVDVDLHMQGNLSALSPATGLAAYRIVQESLANAAKHAAGAPVKVDVHVGRRRLEVRVVNGPPVLDHPVVVPPSAGGKGHGTAGMIERARLLGGKAEIGPRGDGWRVCALLPVAACTTTDVAAFT